MTGILQMHTKCSSHMQDLHGKARELKILQLGMSIAIEGYLVMWQVFGKCVSNVVHIYARPAW